MLISVITINYNNVLGITRTINSVFSQTFKNYEFIIIDGGSDDGSIDVIKENQKQISYWVSEKDNGIYHAMNKGVQLAHGDYCIFMNSGDCFYCSTVLEKISKYDIGTDIIVGKVSIDDKDSIISPAPEGELTFYHLYSGSIPHQGSFIRTELLRKYPYDEHLRISSDWKFFVQTMILDNCSVRFVDEYIALYNLDGISSINPQLMREEKEKVMNDLLPQRIIADYKNMKASECLTQTLTSKLRINYSIDKILYRIGFVLLKLKDI